MTAATPNQTGVLLMAYGAPGAPEDIAPFYTDIRRGRRPPPDLLAELTARYDAIGGKSPLLDITRRQAAALGAALGADYRVYIGMRHWTPWIRDAIGDMIADGIHRAVALVLAPHYSRMSVARYMALADEAIAAAGSTLALKHVESWHTQPALIDALTSRVADALTRFSAEEQTRVRILFTAHSLPERILEWQDPYPQQIAETARRIAERVAPRDWEVAYQSAGRTPEPWLGPDLTEVIARSQPGDAILVCVVGFVTDNLEVLYDIDHEAKAAATERGVHLERITMLNDAPELAQCLATVVRNVG